MNIICVVIVLSVTLHFAHTAEENWLVVNDDVESAEVAKRLKSKKFAGRYLETHAGGDGDEANVNSYLLRILASIKVGDSDSADLVFKELISAFIDDLREDGARSKYVRRIMQLAILKFDANFLEKGLEGFMVVSVVLPESNEGNAVMYILNGKKRLAELVKNELTFVLSPGSHRLQIPSKDNVFMPEEGVTFKARGWATARIELPVLVKNTGNSVKSDFTILYPGEGAIVDPNSLNVKWSYELEQGEHIQVSIVREELLEPGFIRDFVLYDSGPIASGNSFDFTDLLKGGVVKMKSGEKYVITFNIHKVGSKSSRVFLIPVVAK